MSFSSSHSYPCCKTLKILKSNFNPYPLLGVTTTSGSSLALTRTVFVQKIKNLF